MNLVTPEYRLISDFYDGKSAKRSGLPYMRHIDQGVALLASKGESGRVQRAFMIHPLVQGNADLVANVDKLAALDGAVVALAMEYRRVANSYPSSHYLSRNDGVPVSPLRDVNAMLWADKTQNLADLLDHNREHPKFEWLLGYFENWLTALNDLNLFD